MHVRAPAELLDGRSTDVILIGTKPQLWEEVREAVRALPREQIEVIELAFFADKAHAEIARDLRRAEYGDSSGLLEPDLKNGLGGLRDVHQIHWLMRVDQALKDGPAAVTAGLRDQAEERLRRAGA